MLRCSVIVYCLVCDWCLFEFRIWIGFRVIIYVCLCVVNCLDFGLFWFVILLMVLFVCYIDLIMLLVVLFVLRCLLFGLMIIVFVYVFMFVVNLLGCYVIWLCLWVFAWRLLYCFDGFGNCLVLIVDCVAGWPHFVLIVC